jgi:hypothetical protein
MTRKITQWPKVKPGDYDRWLSEFEVGFVRALLAKFPPIERDQIAMMLFAAWLGPRQLRREEVKRIWPELAELNTRINLTDYVIACLASRLKGKTRTVNEDIAALLTAAVIPGGRGKTGGWSPGAVKKRRRRTRRVKGVSIFGPRLLLQKLFVPLLRAHRLS